ncbi:MAG TPA: deoxynucleoside kinase, partial [Cupriavidus sp.]|nr:deoxynucleoside kinase [Cupriavidus sp.]
MLDHLRRIVIEGPVGSGKAALAQRLARHLQAGELPDGAR